MKDASLLPLPSPHFAILKKRAMQSLANPNEIEDSLLHIVLQESHEICKGRDVPSFARIDVAYVRLKLYMKIELNGEDEMLYKNALQIIKESPILDSSGKLNGALFYQSALRHNPYDRESV